MCNDCLENIVFLNKIQPKVFVFFFVLFCFFVFFFLFYFIKISKFAFPGVMLMYERTSNERKKERMKSRILNMKKIWK